MKKKMKSGRHFFTSRTGAPLGRCGPAGLRVPEGRKVDHHASPGAHVVRVHAGVHRPQVPGLLPQRRVGEWCRQAEIPQELDDGVPLCRDALGNGDRQGLAGGHTTGAIEARRPGARNHARLK